MFLHNFVALLFLSRFTAARPHPLAEGGAATAAAAVYVAKDVKVPWGVLPRRTLASTFWEGKEEAVGLEECAGTCATAYSSCAFFAYAHHQEGTEAKGGSCELYGAGGLDSLDPVVGLPHWFGYVEGKGQPLNRSDGVTPEYTLMPEVAPYTPEPLSTKAKDNSLPFADGCTLHLSSIPYVDAIVTTYHLPPPYLSHITLPNCSACGWTKIEDWPEFERYYYVKDIYQAGYPLVGGTDGWRDSVWGCLEPEEGYYAPYGIPIPQDRCEEQGALPSYTSCTCKEGMVFVPEQLQLSVLKYQHQGLTADLEPCMTPEEAFGCPADMLANTTYGCTACPDGYHPIPVVEVPGQLNDPARKCASCSHQPGPMQLMCLDNAHCHPANVTVSESGTIDTFDFPWCSACPPEHFMHDECRDCETLGCAVGGCDERMGCTACADGAQPVDAPLANRFGVLKMCDRGATLHFFW